MSQKTEQLLFCVYCVVFIIIMLIGFTGDYFIIDLLFFPAFFFTLFWISRLMKLARENKSQFMKIIKYFIGGAVAGAICMFFVKLYFETQWRSDDIQTIITFGFMGLLFLLPPFKKKSQFMKKHKFGQGFDKFSRKQLSIYYFCLGFFVGFICMLALA